MKKVDHELVHRVNDRLAATTDLDHQREWGQVLGRLLMPDDLRSWLFAHDRVVMILDTNTARFHWELLAPSDLDIARSNPGFGPGRSPGPFPTDDFLGTARVLSRQFSSTFGAAPEPPPPPRRTLKVLVVADPSEHDPLPDAEEEGKDLVELFDLFNKFSDGDVCSVDVQHLIGPGEARREDVLREVLLRRYDVLHYSGHCYFNPGDPAASGWIFGRKEAASLEVLSAQEIGPIDRVPKFVFSNACESGVTPERVADEDRFDPSFAEAFFQKGVANLVCTAWPVGDRAARRFALDVYAALLGLELSWSRDRPGEWDVKGPVTPPAAISSAMLDARKDLAKNGIGKKTWGAYQHYGNPDFRLLDRTQWRTVPGPGFRTGPRRGRERGGSRPAGAGSDGPAGAKASSRAGAATEDQLREAGTLEAFRKIARAIEQHRDAILGLSEDILDVRPGYRFEDGWITGKPALILSVRGGPTWPGLIESVERLGLGVAVRHRAGDPDAAAHLGRRDAGPHGRLVARPGREGLGRDRAGQRRSPGGTSSSPSRGRSTSRKTSRGGSPRTTSSRRGRSIDWTSSRGRCP